MITCLGLVVGAVMSADRQTVLSQMTAFLKKHRHLLDYGVSFEIDGVTYATVDDICEDRDELWVLFRLYDDRISAGIA